MRVKVFIDFTTAQGINILISEGKCCSSGVKVNTFMLHNEEAKAIEQAAKRNGERNSNQMHNLISHEPLQLRTRKW